MELYYSALTITSRSLRAVLIKEGKVIDRFFIDARGDVALEEFIDFIFHSLRNVKHFSYLRVILVGCGRGRRWTRLHKLLEQIRPGAFQLDILKGPDIDCILATDRLLREDPAFHQLELLAYISSVRDDKQLESPAKALLEWMLNRSREQILRLIDIDKNHQQKAILFSKNESYEQLSF